jgi:hypothetical protein
MRWVLRVSVLTAAAVLASTLGYAADTDGPSIIEVTDHPAGVSANRAEIDEGGNLVIYGAGGYKRIIVDGGSVLDRAGVDVDDLFKDASGHHASPSIVYYGGPDIGPGDAVDVIRRPKHADPVIVTGECIYGTAVVRGRSYMYGVDRNQTPVLVNDCR